MTALFFWMSKETFQKAVYEDPEDMIPDKTLKYVVMFQDWNVWRLASSDEPDNGDWPWKVGHLIQPEYLQHWFIKNAEGTGFGEID